MTETKVTTGEAGGKQRQQYEEWRDIALRMGDRMAEKIAEAAEPDRLQMVAQRMESADGWRRQYDLARAEMLRYAEPAGQS